MKELFSKAVQKMKRKDFLDDFIREKTAEEAKITAEVAILRKKNGKQVGSELDLQIFQLNRRKVDIQKLIAKCKAEIKTLKSEISDLLIQCYALTDKPELREKVNSAFCHAFDGKSKLVSDKDVGGVMGDCEIVGAIITHDKKKRNQTAKLERAGIVNSLGIVTVCPQIIVYEYDKKQEEGIFHKEDNSFKVRVKQPKPHPNLEYFKDVYSAKTIIFSILIAIVYSAFAICMAYFDMNSIFKYSIYECTGILGACLFGHTFATVKKAKKGGVSDILPLSAIIVAIVSAISHHGAFNNIGKELVFPITLFIYGVFSIIFRKKLSKANEESQNGGATFVLSIVIGVLLAFITERMSLECTILGTSGNVYMTIAKVIAFSVLGVGLISSIGCLVMRGKEEAYGFSYLITIACSYLVINVLTSYGNTENLILGSICVAYGVCALIGLKRKGEKDGL